MAAIKTVTKTDTKKPAAKHPVPKKTPQPVPFKKPTKEKVMKPIFKGLVMSFSGTFINLGKPVAHEQVAKWIVAHAGEYKREVTSDTTHLICSIEDYQKRTEQVQRAWALGQTRCQTVVFEWIVDCLLGPKLQKRLRPERGYTLDRTLRNFKKGQKALEAYRAKFENGVRISKDLCNNELNHIYYDLDGFEYKVVLTRVNLGGRVLTEKYTLFLFESNAKPHHYMFGAKFSRPHRRIAWYNLHCYPMLFSQAFKFFREFFEVKTGIPWDMRLEKRSKVDEGLFIYTPPVPGRPTGNVPWGYIRPELREEESDSPKSATDVKEAVEYDTDSEVDEDEEQGNESSSTESAESGPEWEMLVRPAINPVPTDPINVPSQSLIIID